MIQYGNPVGISVLFASSTCGRDVPWISWWRYQMETFSALLAHCEGNPPVTGGFPSQRSVKRGFDAFFDLHLNKWFSKQSRRWWFDTPPHSLWRHCNDFRLTLNRGQCTLRDNYPGWYKLSFTPVISLGMVYVATWLWPKRLTLQWYLSGNAFTI